jgi:nicotinate-nucleotide pyrophosphorylase (carboxylating)
MVTDPATLLSFIAEDSPFGDVTSDLLLPPGSSCTGVIRSRQAGFIAGLEEAVFLFTHFGARVVPAVEDGEQVSSGTVLLSISGPARSVLLVERTALNIIGRMSGIATMTRRAASLISSKNPSCRIAATRKTAPGLRDLDKKAVRLGGGDPHRYTLSDGILIKDNHLALVSLGEAVQRGKAHSFTRKVEVEVENLADAVTAAHAGADILLLDNMTPDEISRVVTLLKKEEKMAGLIIEVSGGITLENVSDYAIPGVDVISMGSLTHSVVNFDVGLDIDNIRRPCGI